jgi:hypothetical protein
MQVAALIQNASETAYSWAMKARLHYILPLVLSGGRSMHLLRGGQWIDTTVHVPREEILYTYDVEKHVISSVSDSDSDSDSQSKRWPWLSVVTRCGVDISEFFSSLRVPAEHTLTANNVLMLYAHQKGVLYTRDLEVTGRDGSPISL